MKDSRNPSAWTLPEISQDSAGYVAAQQAHKAEADAAKARRDEERDRDRHVTVYMANGGSKADALDDYRQQVNAQAAQAAATADEAARRGQRGATMGRL